MKTMTQRILSFVLCFVMLIGILPVNALAADNVEGTTAVTESTEAFSALTEESTAPAETSAPAEETSAPTQETEQPTEESTAPVETSAPVEETSAPTLEAEQPTEEYTVPVEETTAPEETLSSPMEDVGASTEENAMYMSIMLIDDAIEALAEDNGVVEVVAASDFQQNDGHAASDSVMEGIIAAIKKDYADIDGALFCGDYSNNYTASDSGIGLGYVYDNYNTTWGLDYDDIIFVQGNHDPAGTSNLDSSGANDPASGAYGVFVIHEDDYGWANGDYGKSETEIKATAANLKTYLDAKLAAKFDKPIFITSHLPLHYSMRTYNDGDCQYAQYIFDVLNDAAKNGLNIFYLYGHNHSQSFENYHGGGAVFYSAGDSILIGDTSSNKTHHTETIQFTYLNAGYTGRFDSTDTADSTNTATVFEIHDDYVKITRYDASGTHNLKSAGVQSQQYSAEANLYSVNTRVETSPQTIKLNQFVPDATVTDETTGITVTAPGVTGTSIRKIDNPEYDTEKFSAYVAYDITVTGYEQGDTATVTIPVDNSFEATRSVVVIDKEKGTTETKNIKDGKVTFTTTHFSEYDIGQYDVSTGVTADGTLSATKVWRKATSFTSGETYLLVSNNLNENGTVDDNYNYMAMTLSGTNVKGTQVTIQTDSNGMYIEDSDATSAMKWTATASGNNGKFKLTNGSYQLQLFGDNPNYVGTSGVNDTAYSDFFYWGITEGNGLSVLASYQYNNSPTDAGIIRYSKSGDNNNKGYTVNNHKKTYVEVWQLIGGDTTGTVSMAVTPSSLGLLPGTNSTLAATVLVNNAEVTNYTITWSSDNTAIATVDSNGVVTGVTDGTANITATLGSANGQKPDKTVSVTIPVTVQSKEIKSIAVAPMAGSVERGSGTASQTGSTLTVTFDDNSTMEVPVTVSMLSGSYSLKTNGSYSGLTVTYAGKTVTGYTLNVVNVTGNDFPTYPNGGSVQVNKTAKGEDFQNTGIARVELSTSGLPSQKGVDLIVMLDTSSSMLNNKVDDGSQTRAEALQEALVNLIGQLQANGPDGKPLDINIAIADFNGYYVSNTDTTRPYNLETTDHLKGTSVKENADNCDAEVYTGTRALNADAFVDVHTIDGQALADRLDFDSGTNYDYAFDAIYQLGSAIQSANTEDRDLFVIFMSDGGPFQYNYFSTQSDSARWNNWMTGNVVDDDWDDKTHSYFYNPQGKHWMAEAIKGDTDSLYTVIRKNATNFIDVTGDGVADQYMTQLYGLGATMYSIGFCAEKDDTEIKAASIQHVLKNIASDPSLYFTANTGDDLKGIFSGITDEIRYAAQNAYFVDQMGEAFDLQMNPNIVDSSGKERADDISTDITITSYPIYTQSQVETTVDGHTVTNEDVGKSYGTGTVLETVKFTSDSAATSTALTDENIIKDGVIYAKYFWYNTKPTAVQIDTDGNGTAETTLDSEAFYWNIGLINEKKFVLSYAVYLTGAMEGKAQPGESYETNNYATLHYQNWLGNDVKQDVPSPVMPWGGANVSYAFYLVNDQGKPVNANGTVVPNIVTAYKVTQPVVYEVLTLNSGTTVSSTTLANEVLPEGYTLYDPNATYTIKVNSGSGGGSWTITGESNDKLGTTYVTGYAGAQDYSNATSVTSANEEEKNYDFTHTTVYFAVVWSVGALPDTVVIDYGLPVDISVLTNDMFGEYGKLAGVGATNTEGVTLDSYTSDNKLPNTSYTGTYGVATADTTTGKVRYSVNTMAMNGYEKFAYAVNYTGTINPGYYYNTVTVIPATTIYYEDSFLTYTASGTEWVDEGTAIEGATQSEDRPGKYSLTDANNIYGYDGVNMNMSTYSLGTAKKVHVDASSYATASFTFSGTGFDVISMTSNTTGTIAVQVKAAETVKINGTEYAAGSPVAKKVVNTYYGYTSEQHEILYTYTDGAWVAEDKGKATESTVTTKKPETPAEGATYTATEQVWVATPNTENALYQVPVLQIEELPYSKYEVTITATYAASIDKTTADGYDLYLDAIRIYDPANDGAAGGTTDTTIEDAYKADGEGWPSYIELRNKIIAASSFDKVANDVLTTDMEGLVFIDGDASVGDAQISDYISYGPNNEVYLAPGQRVAFLLNTPANVANVHIGIKSADGNAGTYTITNVARNNSSDNKVKAGDYYGASTYTISTTTDMYYDLTSWKGDIIVISNTGDRYKTTGIISLTNIKSTYTSDPNGVVTASVEEETLGGETSIYVTPAAVAMTLSSLNEKEPLESTPGSDVPETTAPEETEPETTVPEETEPETTEPEETVPETTKPGLSEPEGNKPGNQRPQVEEMIRNMVNTLKNVMKNLFGGRFR